MNEAYLVLSENPDTEIMELEFHVVFSSKESAKKAIEERAGKKVRLSQHSQNSWTWTDPETDEEWAIKRVEVRQ